MDRPSRFRHDVAHFGKGLLMGGADIIPGVSGGTMALILGIYERLVTAISHFDLQLVGALRNKCWAEAARHVDLRFLVVLGCGILSALFSLAKIIHFLLLECHQDTLAAFFGLILASTLLVGRMVAPRSRQETIGAFALGVAAAIVAFWLVAQPYMQPRPGYGYLFLCGMIAICAMILPGISGAFILLLLGKYAEILGVVKDIASLRVTPSQLATLIVFVAGCVVGLLTFSKILRWLLARHHAVTMAALCGIMLGSLRKIWPFQIDRTPNLPLEKKMYENFMPGSITSDVVITALIAVAAVVFVLVLDRIVQAAQKADS